MIRLHKKNGYGMDTKNDITIKVSWEETYGAVHKMEGLAKYWETSKQKEEMARKQKRNTVGRKNRLDNFSRLLEEPSLATTSKGVYVIFYIFAAICFGNKI
jgi:hypothetical protein